MKIHGSTLSAIVLGCLINLFPHSSAAQQSVSGIGSDPIQREAYECVRFNNVKQNTIQVTSFKNGKEKSLSLKKARANLNSSLKELSKRTKLTRQTIKELEKKIRKLIDTIDLSDAKVIKLAKFRASLAQLESRITDFDLSKAILQETLRGVARCGEQENFSGGLLPVIGTYQNSRGVLEFYVNYYFVFENWDPNNGRVCVKESRFSLITEYRPLEPIGCLVKDDSDSSICYLTAQSVFSTRYYVSVAGIGGPLRPGDSCPLPDKSLCSIEKAQARIEGELAGNTLTVLGVIPKSSASDCTDLFG